jgi:hypothetical protein
VNVARIADVGFEARPAATMEESGFDPESSSGQATLSPIVQRIVMYDVQETIWGRCDARLVSSSRYDSPNRYVFEFHFFLFP